MIALRIADCDWGKVIRSSGSRSRTWMMWSPSSSSSRVLKALSSIVKAASSMTWLFNAPRDAQSKLPRWLALNPDDWAPATFSNDAPRGTLDCPCWRWLCRLHLGSGTFERVPKGFGIELELVCSIEIASVDTVLSDASFPFNLERGTLGVPFVPKTPFPMAKLLKPGE
jgi:hypothetical protein